MPRRAITLGGGGPAAGLHIGVLEAFANADPLITFDVWSLSCIGAWVGIVYNQSASDKDSEKKAIESARSRKSKRHMSSSRTACFETMRAMSASR